ncbi:MAG: hypothetical protein ACOYJB_03490 [Christensenellaceae bacterium]|jgi:cell division protein FtsL
MNAIPQKAHNYNRVVLPKTPPMERTRDFPRIETIDEVRIRRMQKQRSSANGRPQQAKRPQGYSDVLPQRGHKSSYTGYFQPVRETPARQKNYERYYRSREQSYEEVNHIGERRQRPLGREAQAPRSKTQWNSAAPTGRKLTPAYEVNRRPKRHEPQTGYKLSGMRYYGQSRPAAKRAPEIVAYDMEHTGGRAALYGREARKEEAQYSAAAKKGVFSTILLIVAVFLILTAVLMMQAKISDATYQNTKLDSSIAELNQQLDKVKMDIALEQDLSNVQERAEALGMSHPKDNQIVYVNLDETVTADAAGLQESAQNEGAVDNAETAGEQQGAEPEAETDASGEKTTVVSELFDKVGDELFE